MNAVGLVQVGDSGYTLEQERNQGASVRASEIGKHGRKRRRIRLAQIWGGLHSGEQESALYLGVFALGHVFPTVALTAAFMLNEPVAVALAGGAALLGIFLWDHLYVGAGQAPPLS